MSAFTKIALLIIIILVAGLLIKIMTVLASNAAKARKFKKLEEENLNSMRNKRRNASYKMRIATSKLKLISKSIIKTKRDDKGSSDD